MSFFHLKAANLTESGKKKQRYVQSILQPIEQQEGFLFALFDIQEEVATAAPLVTAVVEHLERATQSMTEESHVQHRFEQMIGAINETLLEQSKEETWNIPIEHVNALIGIALDDTIFLTGIGELTALFLHKTPESSYQIFNLFRGIQQEQGHLGWEKPFIAVLDGQLHGGDVFCLINQPVQQQIPPEQLHTILTNLPPQGSIEQIRQQFPLGTHLGMCVLQVLSKEGAKTPPLLANSLEHFSQTQEKTARLLDEGSFGMGVILQKTKNWILSLRLFSGKTPLRYRLHPIIKYLFSFLLVTGKLLLDAGPHLYHLLSPSFFKKHHHRLQTSFKKVGKTSRYLILGGGIIFLLFVTSLFFLSHKRNIEETKMAYVARIEHIENLRDEASGALIYKNEQQAQTLLTQAIQEIQYLPQETEEEQQTTQRLSQEIETLLQELRHVVKVIDPVLLAHLDTIVTDLQAETIASDNDALYVFGNNGNVYRFTEVSQQFINQSTSAIPKAKQSSFDNGLFAILTENSIAILKENASVLVNPPELQSTEKTKQKDVVVYGSRLYVLTQEADDGTILRYDENGGNYGSAKNWIQAKETSLSDAVSLAIDGTIFVLKEDGNIVHFANNSEIKWNQDPIDPPLQSPTHIWTNESSSYLYILEPQGKRIVVFEKETGHFLLQYTSDAFSDLKDFVIDEKNKQMYLLSGKQLYRINASHIK